MTSYIDRYICINLDRRPDRWAHMQSVSRRFNLNLERFSAIDADKLAECPDKINPKFEYPIGGFLKTIALSKSEWAVIMSNITVWKRIAQEGGGTYLILEDDTLPDYNFSSLIEEGWKSIPDDWDIVLLGEPGGPRDKLKEINSDIYQIIDTYCCCYAYCVRKHSAKELLDYVAKNKVSGPLDWYFKILSKEMKIYCFIPPLIMRKDMGSDVFHSSIPKPKHKLCKEVKNFLKANLPFSFIIKYRFLRQIFNLQSGQLPRIRMVYNMATRIYINKRTEIKKILEENWDRTLCLSLKNKRMEALGEIIGMGTEYIYFLINETVRKFAKNGVYLECGIYRGKSLLSAALFNDSTRCIGIDNFFQFNPDGDNESILRNNLKKFANLRNIEYYVKDYREAIKDLSSREPGLKISVYYYDGNHVYDDQLEGLRIILPYLAQRCVILVDDINLECVEKANRKFIKENPDFISVFRIKTERIGAQDWGSGFEVITRGF